MFLGLKLGVLKLFQLASGNEVINNAAAQSEALNGDSLNPLLLLLIIIVLLVPLISILNLNLALPKLIASIKAKLSKISYDKITGDPLVDTAIKTAGYSYDTNQDIFFSNLNAWQRDMGYCRLYDESAAPLGMIIDCEPVQFEYKGRRWLIEFWKGQYDLTTGCEVGIYSTDKPDLNIPGIFNGPFYYSANDGDLLKISYYLQKGKKILFTRKDRHWWLTGFMLGEFSEPSDLVMHISITLKDKEMLTAFVNSLIRIGYSKKELAIYGTTVVFKFKTPKTQQPYTRTKKTDAIIQEKNKLLCDMYQEVTKPYKTFPDKVKAIKENSPELYRELLRVGRSINISDTFEKIRYYLK
jgi:hypothetical protein